MVVAVGATVMDVWPLYALNKVPPQDPVYHFQEAPAPNVPPLMVRVMFSPAQILLKSRLEVMEFAAMDGSETVTLKLAVEINPYTSVAVYVTVVVPLGKTDPGTCEDVT